MDAKKYLNADFLDILFDGRNKQYGAYQMRRQHPKRMVAAMLGTALLIFLFVGGMALSKYIIAHAPKKEKPIDKDVVLEQVEMDAPENLPPPPPPPPAPEPPKLKTTVKYTPPEVVEDELVPPDEQPPDISKINDDVAIGTSNVQGDPNGIDPGLVQEAGTGVVAAAPKPKEDKIFQFVEQMPEFPGGEKALFKYLNKNIHYPSIARENDIQGTIVVQFVVNSDGTIVDIKTVGQKKGGGLEDEAMRVVKAMPKWTPGKQNGSPVRVQFSLPVRFTLQ